MKKLIFLVVLLTFAGSLLAAPRIAVFRFAPLMDSTYNWWGDQVKVLNYQQALHGFLASDMRSDTRFEVVSIDKEVCTVPEAVAAAREAKADFAVIGTYAELPTAIRADAQLVDIGLGAVPRGYQASASAGRWDDLSDVAASLAIQLLNMTGASSTPRSESVSHLVLEGDRAALGFGAGSQVRLVVEINSPAPKVTLSKGSVLKRCSAMDRSLAEGTQHSQICYSGDVPAGEQSISISQRGYYGHEESLNLVPGKVYRLIVELQPMSFQAVPSRQ